MVNVMLLTTEVSDGIVGIFMDDLVPIFKQATVKSLGDVGLNQVSVHKSKSSATENTVAMRVLVIGNLSPERKRRQNLCAILLAKAWRQFAIERQIEWIDQVEIWPVIVEGFCLKTTEKNICEAVERFERLQP